MALLLHIDTATEYAGVCLSGNSTIIGIEENNNPKNHAGFLQPAIQKIMQQSGKTLQDLDAIAVTGGPGSYTGIRVGMASAKGICFALNKPLIVLNTLQVIAQATLKAMQQEDQFPEPGFLIYPMIDARRMEVFAGIYTEDLTPVGESAALVLEKEFFASLTSNFSIVFCGNGSLKIPVEFLGSTRIVSPAQHNVNHMITLAEQAFSHNEFADLAYAEPLYVKEFYSTKQ